MTEIRVIRHLPTEWVRVHPQPDVLHSPPLGSSPEARSRFDDPYAHYAVRYLATTLRGCLVETMSRFRPAPDIEAELADVDGVDDDDADPSRQDGLREWLDIQHVGYCEIMIDAPQIVDVDDAASLVALDKHPLVREALDNSGLGSALNPARLDTAVIRLPGRIGRPITQAVSRAVREWYTDVHGLAYRSRVDGAEQCWALYEHTPVKFRLVQLLPSNAYHRETVRLVARLFEIDLPDAWA